MKQIKIVLVFATAALCVRLCAAQQADDLSVTLPTGKVLTFQTEEQKAKYLAAKERMRQASATGSATPGSAPAPRPVVLGNTSLDEKPAMNGKVNVSAPTFTADYYLFAPETWVGKQITLSVAYLTPSHKPPQSDGMVELEAHTYGTVQASASQRSGGDLMIRATPPAAQRITLLCGTTWQYNGWGDKVTLIRGELQVVNGTGAGGKQYALIVTK